jgi:hypothetical protein
MVIPKIEVDETRMSLVKNMLANLADHKATFHRGHE